MASIDAKNEQGQGRTEFPNYFRDSVHHKIVENKMSEDLDFRGKINNERIFCHPLFTHRRENIVHRIELPLLTSSKHLLM